MLLETNPYYWLIGCGSLVWTEAGKVGRLEPLCYCNSKGWTEVQNMDHTFSFCIVGVKSFRRKPLSIRPMPNQPQSHSEQAAWFIVTLTDTHCADQSRHCRKWWSKTCNLNSDIIQKRWLKYVPLPTGESCSLFALTMTKPGRLNCTGNLLYLSLMYSMPNIGHKLWLFL